MNRPQSKRPVRVLLLEDNANDRELIARALAREGLSCELLYAANQKEFVACLQAPDLALILSDYTLPDYQGLEALKTARKIHPNLPFIVVSGTLGEEQAVDSLKAGATDYVLKERLERLGPVVRRALAEEELRQARQDADETLLNSEQRWRVLFEYAPDACYLHDLQGKFIEGNKAAEELVGYSRQELVGHSLFDLNLLGVTDLAVAASGLARNAQGLPSGPTEYRLRKKDGAEVVAEIRTFPLRFQDQVLVLGIARDITERKSAEQELRDSEERFHAVWDNSLDAMRLCDHAGRIIAVNEAYSRLFKLSRERLLGELFTATYADQTAEGLLESFRSRSTAGQVTPRLTTRVKLWNGDELDLEISNSSIELGQRGRMILSIFRDVTDRSRTEAALHAVQQRLNYLLDQSPAVIYALRIEGDKLVPDWFSNYIQHLLGFTPEESCRPDWWLQQIHPADRPGLQRVLDELIQRKQIVREYRIRHKQGEYRWIRDEQRLAFDAQGEPIEVLGSWVDITDHKGLEELFRQSQKMEAIGRLAGGVAHDFNNLLLVMRGNAELLLLDAEQYSLETQESLRQITAAADRAANLTRQLLAFSRKQVMQSEPVKLNEIIANVAKMLKRIIGENIDLQCRYGEALPLIQADTGMIEQALINLVVNARDAMPRGGRLEISTEKCLLSQGDASSNPEARAGEFVALVVRDTGHGINPEHLPHIFEPFFTTKEAGKGTGLGLATVYGILKQHQGWIEVFSRQGEGATFTLFLPALPATAGPAKGGPSERAPRGGTESILLVEDELSVRLITRRVLESFGYKVQEASHAEEALQLWATQPNAFQLLLTDIVMPQGLTGRDLAERLRAKTPALKVIFMSGYSPDTAGKDTEFFRRNRTYFIQKPCSSRTLLEIVRTCLDEPAPA